MSYFNEVCEYNVTENFSSVYSFNDSIESFGQAKEDVCKVPNVDEPNINNCNLGWDEGKKNQTTEQVKASLCIHKCCNTGFDGEKLGESPTFYCDMAFKAGQAIRKGYNAGKA